mmetsp:Transcript_47310/g.134980  ORF Transcript_47310/g.134980 Transcript_47310/m.134980 type:complete len:298 (-) Transcript_47310:238-1131(-)
MIASLVLRTVMKSPMQPTTAHNSFQSACHLPKAVTEGALHSHSFAAAAAAASTWAAPWAASVRWARWLLAPPRGPRTGRRLRRPARRRGPPAGTPWGALPAGTPWAAWSWGPGRRWRRRSPSSRPASRRSASLGGTLGGSRLPPRGVPASTSPTCRFSSARSGARPRPRRPPTALALRPPGSCRVSRWARAEGPAGAAAAPCARPAARLAATCTGAQHGATGWEAPAWGREGHPAGPKCHLSYGTTWHFGAAATGACLRPAPPACTVPRHLYSNTARSLILLSWATGKLRGKRGIHR